MDVIVGRSEVGAVGAVAAVVVDVDDDEPTALL